MQLNEFYWVKKDKDKIAVGFTPQGLATLGQIWNFIMRVEKGKRVYIGQAIATVETTNQLRSLTIPLDGVLVDINKHAIDNPETISEETQLFAFSQVSNALPIL